MWYSWRINAFLSQPVSQTFHELLKWWTQSESKASGQNKGLNVSEILLPENRDVAARACPSDPWGAQKAELTTDQITSPACTHSKTGQELKKGILRFDKTMHGIIIFLLRTVWLWSGTLHRLYQTLPSHTALAMLLRHLASTSSFLNPNLSYFLNLRNLHFKHEEYCHGNFMPFCNDDGCILYSL